MFGFRKRPSKESERRVPADTVVWAVGDVHGRHDLLSALTDHILLDLRSSSAERKVLVFLGDHIDRGPQSREVIDLLIDLGGIDEIETRFLRGNHEDRMEAVLTAPQVAPAWCEYGGAETMRSYGVEPPSQRHDAEGWIAAVAKLNESLPESHRAFLASQEWSLTIGDYFFAHAGARPGISLDSQSEHDLIWIRHDFLADSRVFDRLVVHGHTPTKTVESDRRRVGIDTGAYATGVLTGLRLEGADRRLAQTSAADGRISVSNVLV